MYEISIENYKLVILTTLAVLALKWPATSKDPRGSTAFENWRMKGDSKKKKKFFGKPNWKLARDSKRDSTRPI